MLKWLLRPYPFLVNRSIKLALSMLVGLICFLFLLVFRPFGLEEVQEITYLFGFGFIAFLVLMIHYFLFPKIWGEFFNEEMWTIGKQLLLFTSIILFTGTSIYIYNSTIGNTISPQYNLPSFIYFAFAVGILPIIFMTYFIEKVSSERNSALAKSILIPRTEKSSKAIIIESENQNEKDLKIIISDFIYAKANGNYTDIIFKNGGVNDNYLMRISLKKLQDHLLGEGQIIRCHKSYLINKNFISSMEGNARSLILNIKEVNVQIPVSRSISKSAFE